MRSKTRCKSKALSALSDNEIEQRDRESENQRCGDTEAQSIRGYGVSDDTHDADELPPSGACVALTRLQGYRRTRKNTDMTLTKRDLVMRISEETGLIQSQVFEVVQKTLNYITESLAKGDKVELRNFGVFDVKIRKARVGRNPKKPENEVQIPARSMVKFKAGKEMKAEVLKLTPKPTKKAP